MIGSARNFSIAIMIFANISGPATLKNISLPWNGIHIWIPNPIDITYASTESERLDREEWKVEINRVPKLRTHVLFKTEYHVESYITQITSKKYRAVLAQFRSGILPLEVETGRFSNIPLVRRLCEFSSSNSLKMRPTFFFIVFIIINCERIYLIKSLSHSRISTNWINTTRLKSNGFSSHCEIRSMLPFRGP